VKTADFRQLTHGPRRMEIMVTHLRIYRNGVTVYNVDRGSSNSYTVVVWSRLPQSINSLWYWRAGIRRDFLLVSFTGKHRLFSLSSPRRRNVRFSTVFDLTVYALPAVSEVIVLQYCDLWQCEKWDEIPEKRIFYTIEYLSVSSAWLESGNLGMSCHENSLNAFKIFYFSQIFNQIIFLLN